MSVSTICDEYCSYRYSAFTTSGSEVPYLPLTHGGPPTINIPLRPKKKSSKQIEAVAPKVAAMVNRLCLLRKKLTGLKRKTQSLLMNEDVWNAISIF